jgi:O-antigen/teichoic acid export membrane protein
MVIHRNLVSNIVGQAFNAFMGLAFIPLYIKYLGMEAYGLIGLFVVMQAWLMLVDLGMTPTINREMARYTAGAHSAQSINNLLRSLEILLIFLAVLIVLGVCISADYMAIHWLKLEKLSTEVVIQSIWVMGLLAALRFVEGVYRGALFGLQRQVWFNSINSIFAILRFGGSVAILEWVSPTINAFFFWQAFVSLLTVTMFAKYTHHALPHSELTPSFSFQALAEVKKFASGMIGITILSLLLTQVDKVLLSRLLKLEDFGYYTLAATLASVIYIVIGPVTAAFFPRLVELANHEDQSELASAYHLGAQLITILSAPILIIICLFGGGVVYLWSGDSNLAEKISPILFPLAIGNFLNGMMSMPYQCQLAYGWTSLTIKVNLCAVIAFIPAIYWITPNYGALGVAWVWVALNASYVLLAINIMHRRVIILEKWRWYIEDVLIPTSGAIGVLLLIKMFQPSGYYERFHWLVYLLCAGGSAVVVTTLLSNRIRSKLLISFYSFQKSRLV